MEKSENKEKAFDAIRRGLLEFLILKIISKSKVYVADILGTLESTDFATQEGTLYPLFGKLRREELLRYEWIESGTGPPRKYYELTALGQKRLEELKKYWQELNSVIKNI